MLNGLGDNEGTNNQALLDGLFRGTLAKLTKENDGDFGCITFENAHSGTKHKIYRISPLKTTISIDKFVKTMKEKEQIYVWEFCKTNGKRNKPLRKTIIVTNSSGTIKKVFIRVKKGQTYKYWLVPLLGEHLAKVLEKLLDDVEKNYFAVDETVSLECVCLSSYQLGTLLYSSSISTFETMKNQVRETFITHFLPDQTEEDLVDSLCMFISIPDKMLIGYDYNFPQDDVIFGLPEEYINRLIPINSALESFLKDTSTKGKENTPQSKRSNYCCICPDEAFPQVVSLTESSEMVCE